MKDFLKVELKLGDSVVLTAPQYRHLVVAKVIAFTNKKVRVSFSNTWNYGDNGHYTEYLSAPDFLVIIPKQEEVL